MTKITELTEGQIARFPEFAEKWTNIGLCTDPADRVMAETAIREMYAGAKLAAPKIVWCGSPFGNAMTRSIVSKIDEASVRDSVWDSVWASVRDSVRASVRDSVWASVRDSVRASVRDSVWDSVWASVRDSVRDSVWDSVWASVGASVRASVWASVRDSVRDSVWASVYGQHDAPWLAFYDYFRVICGLERETDALKWLDNLTQSAGWALPCKSICWVSERTNTIRKDAQGRIHSIEAPAIGYPDGWNIYAVHGTVIPAVWIEDKNSLTATVALAEPNAEKRRAACEILGWSRILSELNATLIDVDPDPMIGELLEVDHPQIGRERFLRATCGTGRIIALPVPPEMQTALQANAWSYNIDPQLYKPEIRT